MGGNLDVVLSRLKGRKKSGNQWVAQCPAHKDSNPSLSVGEGADGRVLLHCFAGCGVDEIVAALSLDPGILFEDSADKQLHTTSKVTVSALSNRTGLSVSYLQSIGLKKDGLSVGVPYYDRDGDKLYDKKRVTLSGKDKYRYPKGAKAVPYGLWKLDEAEEIGALVVVEGESDCWTLWRHNIPAIGIPGSSAYKTLDPSLLTNISKVFIVQESDEAGEVFALAMGEYLRESGFKGEMKVVKFPDGVKDTNAFYLSEIHKFKQAFRSLCRRAKPWTGDYVDDMIQVMSTVEKGSIDFIWQPYIPRGVLTMMGGDPQVGKSSLVYRLVSTLSSGGLLPGELSPRSPMRTLLFSSEDNPGIVIKPRLESNRANLDNIATFNFEEHGFSFSKENLLRLEMMIQSFKPDLVVFDPLVEFIGSKIDIFRANEVRPLLSPLRTIAAEYDIGVLIVAHKTKGTTGRSISDIVGSQDFGAIIRSGLMVYHEDDLGTNSVMTHAKSNMTAQGRSWRFEMTDGQFRWEGEEKETYVERAERLQREYEEAKSVGKLLEYPESKESDIPI